MPYLYHIVPRAAWQAAASRSHYHADTLASEGFMHCSTDTQVADTANRFYRGQADLLLLVIDEARVGPPVRYEPPAEAPASPARFPHIYGPLNTNAVVAVLPFAPGSDGRFAPPPPL